MSYNNNLRRPVRPRLHITAQVIVNEARGPEIDDLARHILHVFHEDVLRLEIAVDQMEAVDVIERFENLNRQLRVRYTKIPFACARS